MIRRPSPPVRVLRAFAVLLVAMLPTWVGVEHPDWWHEPVTLGRAALMVLWWVSLAYVLSAVDEDGRPGA